MLKMPMSADGAYGPSEHVFGEGGYFYTGMAPDVRQRDRTVLTERVLRRSIRKRNFCQRDQTGILSEGTFFGFVRGAVSQRE